MDGEGRTEVVIHWRGGRPDAFPLRRNRRKLARRHDDVGTVELVRRLARFRPDIQIATPLNDQGQGRRSARDRGISDSTPCRWINAGILPAVRPDVSGAPLRVRMGADFRGRFRPGPPEGTPADRAAVRPARGPFPLRKAGRACQQPSRGISNCCVFPMLCMRSQESQENVNLHLEGSGTMNRKFAALGPGRDHGRGPAAEPVGQRAGESGADAAARDGRRQNRPGKGRDARETEKAGWSDGALIELVRAAVGTEPPPPNPKAIALLGERFPLQPVPDMG